VRPTAQPCLGAYRWARAEGFSYSSRTEAVALTGTRSGGEGRVGGVEVDGLWGWEEERRKRRDVSCAVEEGQHIAWREGKVG